MLPTSSFSKTFLFTFFTLPIRCYLCFHPTCQRAGKLFAFVVPFDWNRSRVTTDAKENKNEKVYDLTSNNPVFVHWYLCWISLSLSSIYARAGFSGACTQGEMKYAVLIGFLDGMGSLVMFRHLPYLSFWGSRWSSHKSWTLVFLQWIICVCMWEWNRI